MSILLTLQECDTYGSNILKSETWSVGATSGKGRLSRAYYVTSGIPLDGTTNLIALIMATKFPVGGIHLNSVDWSPNGTHTRQEDVVGET